MKETEKKKEPKNIIRNIYYSDDNRTLLDCMKAVIKSKLGEGDIRPNP